MDAETAFHFAGSFGRYQRLIFGLFCLGNFMGSVQMVLMVVIGATPNLDQADERNLTTIVTEFNLYGESWIVDLISSLYMGGYMIGCLIFGQLSDLKGRRNVLAATGLLSGISGFSSGLTYSWETFAVSRLFTGIFIGGMGAVSFVHLTELMGKSTWVYVGLTYQCCFSLGMMTLALTSYLIQKWRVICMLYGGLIILFIILFLYFVPESPRWLYSVGKIEKSEIVFRKIAQKNGNDPRAIQVTPPPQSMLKPHSFVDFYKHRVLAIMLTAMSCIWFTCSLVYYGLTLSAATLTPDLYVGLLLSGAIELPATLSCLFLLNTKLLGRKGTVILLFVLCVLSNIASLFLYDHSSAMLILGLLNKLFIAAIFAVIYLYTTEIFPTPLRNVAVSTSSMMARVGAMISPFVPLLSSTSGFLPYVVFGGSATLGLISTLFLPETRGKPLPQTIDDVTGSKVAGSRSYVDREDSDDEIIDANFSPDYDQLIA